MMLLMDLGRRALPYLIVLALVGLSLFGAYQHGVNVTATEYELKMQQAEAANMAAIKELSEQARAEEQRRYAELEGVRNDARNQIQQAQADAAAANAAADGLREQSQRLAQRTGEACGNPAATSRGKAGRTTAGLLADLFGEANQEAGAMAAAYDRARAAGTACERAYNALSKDGAQ